MEDLGYEDVGAEESLAEYGCGVPEDHPPPVGPTAGLEAQEPAARRSGFAKRPLGGYDRLPAGSGFDGGPWGA